MEEKQLNLDAPLLSLRRLKVLTFCNSEKMLSQVGIPFDWEKTPGQPKENSIPTATIELNSSAPKLPPGRSSKVASETAVGTTCRNEDWRLEDEEESHLTVKDDAFSMKCSMIAKDSEVKDYFMVGRFLPAAQAIADELPPRTWRKPPRAQVNGSEKYGFQTLGRRRLPLDYQYQQEEEEGDEYDDDDDDEYECYAGSSFLSSKACGLIQRFCFNPVVPGLKAQGRPNSRHHDSIGKAQDEVN